MTKASNALRTRKPASFIGFNSTEAGNQTFIPTAKEEMLFWDINGVIKNGENNREHFTIFEKRDRLLREMKGEHYIREFAPEGPATDPVEATILAGYIGKTAIDFVEGTFELGKIAAENYLMTNVGVKIFFPGIEKEVMDRNFARIERIFNAVVNYEDTARNIVESSRHDFRESKKHYKQGYHLRAGASLADASSPVVSLLGIGYAPYKLLKSTMGASSVKTLGKTAKGGAPGSTTVNFSEKLTELEIFFNQKSLMPEIGLESKKIVEPIPKTRTGDFNQIAFERHKVGNFNGIQEYDLGFPKFIEVDPFKINRGHSLSGRASIRTVENLITSMSEYGWQGGPIEVAMHEGQYYLLDGHHRLAAAKRSNIKVPIKIVEDIKKHATNWNSLEELVLDSLQAGPDKLRFNFKLKGEIK
jgi:hypothetical protein